MDLRNRTRGSAKLLFSALAISGLAGCSLQNFDYLKAGSGGTSSAGAGGGASEAGVGGAGGSAGRGGSVNTGGGGMLAEAGTDTGTDGGSVSVLLNSGFEQGYTGWSFEPTTAMGDYAKTQTAVGTAVTVDGIYELATWSGTIPFTVRVYQTLSNLPDGTYTLSGHFTRGAGLNMAYLYARNCGGPDRQEDILQTGDLEWRLIGIGGVVVTGGQCEIGFYVDSNPSNWLNADAFSFARDLQ